MPKIYSSRINCLSTKYKSSSIVLGPEFLMASNFSPHWGSVAALNCASSGTFFFEASCTIPTPLISPTFKNKKFLPTLYDSDKSSDEESSQPAAAYRIGWACRYDRYDIPIGTTPFSFAIDNFGNCFRNGIRTSVQGFDNECGDSLVIGCKIFLKTTASDLSDELSNFDPQIYPQLKPFHKEGILCDPESLSTPKQVEGSYVQYFVNGRHIPEIQMDLPVGEYHPAVSLFGPKSTVRTNFGIFNKLC
eukprot:GHVP01027960.1.p1 GENE.GHVP01027960.1~~GHVP01027960.1.p1  ORF type:complete len:247 (-),score=44.90 GHVP01027960.1:780-1520(-)